jgi:prepilin-type N-terminal cleavage/methylation domain-containing protein
MPVSHLRRLAREEDGFSLIELMTTMVLGTMVLGALMVVFVRSTTATTEAQNRIETAQTGRLALDRMTQMLDSQTCLLLDDGTSTGNVVATPPVVSGDLNSVTFYADQNPSASSVSPDKYMLKYDPATKAITETRWASIGNEPSLTFATAATSVRTLARDVTYARDTANVQQPVFAYYTFPVVGSTSPVKLAATLDPATVKQVTEIAIQFQPVPRLKGTEDAKHSSSISGQAYLQTADPDAQTVCP